MIRRRTSVLQWRCPAATRVTLNTGGDLLATVQVYQFTLCLQPRNPVNRESEFLLKGSYSSASLGTQDAVDRSAQESQIIKTGLNASGFVNRIEKPD